MNLRSENMDVNFKKLETILCRIHTREAVHIQIPKRNKLVLNKVVPYIFVYRQEEKEDPMLSELIQSQYAYLRGRDPSFNMTEWVTPITQNLADEFGSCLIIEAWIAPPNQKSDMEIHLSRKSTLALAEYLKKSIQHDSPEMSVDLVTKSKLPSPANKEPLINGKDIKNNRILLIGLSINPRYLDHDGNEILPILMRQYRETISKSLSKTFFEFIRIHTLSKPTEFKIASQNELVPLVWEIDQKLAKESQKFDFLLLVTPTNAHDAWLQFKKDNYWKAPNFQYRPMPIDPDIVKRNLYNLRIEDLYDPTLAYLFRDKRKELDVMMSMLSERGKEGFMHGSLQVFGNVSEKLLDKAKAILTIIDETTVSPAKDEEMLNAEEFASLAREEINYLREQHSDFNTTIRIRDDIYGVMVNQGVLNISRQYQISRRRVKALIQHEIGTHIVTYFNGKKQPFNLFKLGVPGYEKLQEGLAVLSEYMVNGLTNDRLRILAGRVIAVDHMLAGNQFVDTFSLLVDQYKFEEYPAFQMTMRVYRGGGLTKDALYLQGLIELVNYIKDGQDISLLTIGKIRKDYIPIIQELMLKGIINPPYLTPRFLNKEYLDKLEELRKSRGIFTMIH